MAIAPTVLTNDGDPTDNTAGTPYATASITPTGPVLMGIVFSTTDSTEPAMPSSVSGNSLSWTAVGNIFFKDTGSSTREKVALYQGIGTPTTGAISVTFGYASAGMRWVVVDIPGAHPTVPIVPGQVATFAGTHSAGASVSATLPTTSAADAGDRCFLFPASQDATAGTYTARASWSVLAHEFGGSPSMVVDGHWRSDTFEATGSVTNNTAGSFRTGLILVEVAIAPTGGGGGAGSHVMLPLTGVG